MSWPMVKLKDCCEVVGGATPKRNIASYWEGDIPWITPKDISNLNSPFIYEAPEHISSAGYKAAATYMLPVGTVLLTSRAPIGNVAIAGIELCTNQGFKSLIPGKNVHNKYLYHCIKKFAPKLELLGNGATFKEVSKTVVEHFEIPLPPFEEQKRIASILDKADVIRQKREETVKLANDYLRATFLEMFGDPVRNPQNWKLEKFGDIADCQLGKMLSKKSKTGAFSKKYLRNANVRWRKIDIHDLLEMDFNEKEISKFELRRGDLLVCEGGEIGRCAIWNNQIKDCYYQKALHRVRPNYSLVTSVYLQEYLYSMAKKNAFSEFISEVTFSHLTAEKLKNLLVPVPPLSLQKKFELIYNKFNSLLSDKYNNHDLSFTLLSNTINENIFK
ncbi:restriction endonuclease subunit S [Escherichia coli]|nr:restriction endonuclease subunit S [Escherichia coli]HBC5378581.1 restriction endonuclease subunit S [Escherichia coli]HDK2489735.1 restriction endonuclease subunit S [Escherichia coli]